MATYRYLARTVGGEEVTGLLDGESEQAVVRALGEKRLFPVRVGPQTRRRVRQRIRPRHVGVVYGQLADLLGSGVPLLRAMETIANAETHRRLAQTIRRLRDEVADGQSLADAMACHPEAFPPLHAAMVRAGERGGFLENVLANLSVFVERLDELRGKVLGAMVYPALLVVALAGVLGVSLVWIVPKFAYYLRDAPSKPLPTRLLFGLSDLVRTDWPLVAALVVLAAFAVWSTVRSESGRRVWDRWRLKLPLFGRAVRMVAVARFCRILGTMLSSGVPILEALSIARGATGSPLLADAVGEAAENVRAGESLAPPLRASGLFPPEVVEMIAVAEESNQLESALKHVADTVERRTNRQVDAAIRLVEPLVLMVIAAAIAFVAVALYYPIFTMAQSLR